MLPHDLTVFELTGPMFSDRQLRSHVAAGAEPEGLKWMTPADDKYWSDYRGRERDIPNFKDTKRFLQVQHEWTDDGELGS